MAGAVRESHKLQQVEGALFGGFLRRACNVGGYHNILQSRELRQQLVELEDEADVAIAEVGQLLLGEGGYVDRIDVHRTAVGAVQRADDLQQGGLASSTWADDADYLATIYVEVNAFQNL